LGRLISDTRDETDLRPSDAESNKSVAVSWTEFTQAVEVFLNSVIVNEQT
jgi:hypothetical protein